MRNQTTEEKVEKLFNNSFNIMQDTFNLQPELQQVITEEIAGIMEYFGDKEVYVVDLPVLLVPHPEVRRSLVDPELRNVPVSKVIHMDSTPFNDIYGLVEYLNLFLEQNREIFIYSIQFIQTYTPGSFEPIRKPILRYETINKDYWYTTSDTPRPQVITRTPNGRNGFYAEPSNRVEILRTPDVEHVVNETDDNIEIVKTINKHNFGNT